MKSENTDLSQRYMVLLKIDAFNLFNRISVRQKDYVEGFSLKRNRAIFKNVFTCRFHQASFFDLSHLPIEIIEVTNDFFTEADKLYWYLMNTQDMPNTIEDEITRYIHLIERKYEVLALYIDAELSGQKEALIVDPKNIPSTTMMEEAFVMKGELSDDEVNDKLFGESEFTNSELNIAELGLAELGISEDDNFVIENFDDTDNNKD